MAALALDRPIYPGLAPFREEQRDGYCGRSNELGAALAILHEEGLVAICGNARVGKTSFLQAGLIPALARDPFPWKVIVAAGSAAPYQALAEAVADAGLDVPGFDGEGEPVLRGAASSKDVVGRIEAFLRQDVDALRLMLSPPQPKGPRFPVNPVRTLVCVDRFEQILQGASEGERSGFAQMLLHACEAEDISVAVALRSEWLGLCGFEPRLEAAIHRGLLVLPPLSGEQLMESIVKPATNAGYSVDAAVAQRLVGAVEHKKHQLPLLQLRLSDRSVLADLLHQSAEVDAVRGEFAKAIGQVRGRLAEDGRKEESATALPVVTADDRAAAAEAVYGGLKPRQRRLAERLMRALWQVPAETGGYFVPVARDASTVSLWAQRSPAAVRRVALAFVEASPPLLRWVDGVEGGGLAPVHADLSHAWTRLADWLHDEDMRADAFLSLAASIAADDCLDRPRALTAEQMDWAERLWGQGAADPRSPWAMRYQPRTGRETYRALRGLWREVLATDPVRQRRLRHLAVATEARLRSETVRLEEARWRAESEARAAARTAESSGSGSSSGNPGKRPELGFADSRVMRGVKTGAKLVVSSVLWLAVVLAAMALVGVAWAGAEWLMAIGVDFRQALADLAGRVGL